jgi:hypothetical protein
MGEVYRADDLKLGQPVALKFLPKTLAADAVRRERLFAEVRIARQVSHPNICRVYDISEIEDRHFLTMEYIDGEDLASLLKRIGSLHGAKALDVARQLCAGLAAAHDRGILHRDLKPANVMIDGRGRVRITDFGLAVVAGEDVAEVNVSGTPPYMAPEQFSGKGASVRSDIYALGLVLYEVFTGRRAFEAKTLAELRAKKEGTPPIAPSEIVREIDPIVERVILRCIEKDPRQRPASAVQVASALPGGDPLAAAIAAGETPSPEMVAASGSTEGIKPWAAWACLAFIILGIGTAVILMRQTALFQRVPMENPPEALAAKAREILKDIGYPDPPADSAYGFGAKDEYFQYVEKIDRSPHRFDKIPVFAVQFWYRQSPRVLQHWAVPLVGKQGVTLSDPPLANGGESIVWLDSRGSLIGLQVVPPEEGKGTSAIQTPDWSVLFKASGLDPAKCTPVESDGRPLTFADNRSAWTVALPYRSEVEMRIDSASWRGKPVSWRLSVPSWDGFSMPVDSPSALEFAVGGIYRFLLVGGIGLIAGGAFFARRNLRMGRGDRRGATRLAFITLILAGAAWIFGEHHVPTLGESYQFVCSFAIWLWMAAWFWLMYIALEPFMRRHSPDLLIGWSRLLAGNFRDPLVGRDLLAGCVAGVFLTLLSYLRYPLFQLIGAPQIRPSSSFLALLEGIGSGWGALYLFSGNSSIVSWILQLTLGCIIIGFALSFVVLLLRILLKSTWAVAIVWVLIAASMNITLGKLPPISSILIVLAVGINVFVYFRFGMLAFAAIIFFFNLLLTFPITTQLSAWHSGIGLSGLILMLAFALYAFHTSLGGQPIFGRTSLDV